jgi:hypothetical protein
LGIETLVTGRGATNVSAGALTVIRRSPKRSNCEAFEVSDLSGRRLPAGSTPWVWRDTLQAIAAGARVA